MLDNTNVLVKMFRMIRDRYKEYNIPSMKLRLISRINNDSSQYELPTSNDIAGLIVGDIGEYEQGRDIIIQDKTDTLQRITKLHPSYMTLQYPLLFPYGEDGFRIDLKIITHNTNNKFLCENFIAINCKNANFKVILFLEKGDYSNSI